mmetsp:Transcript_66265/g.184536  ORF Transcript_66265/g.184536 Transcript_66265/m.184536 type:complete len:307 (-) Transcript_66265:454-1374(-)
MERAPQKSAPASSTAPICAESSRPPSADLSRPSHPRTMNRAPSTHYAAAESFWPGLLCRRLHAPPSRRTSRAVSTCYTAAAACCVGPPGRLLRASTPRTKNHAAWRRFVFADAFERPRLPPHPSARPFASPPRRGYCWASPSPQQPGAAVPPPFPASTFSGSLWHATSRNPTRSRCPSLNRKPQQPQRLGVLLRPNHPLFVLGFGCGCNSPVQAQQLEMLRRGHSRTSRVPLLAHLQRRGQAPLRPQRYSVREPLAGTTRLRISALAAKPLCRRPQMAPRALPPAGSPRWGPQSFRQPVPSRRRPC